MLKFTAAATTALALLLSACGGYDSSEDVTADLPCTGIRQIDNAFFGQPGTRCFMLGGATPEQDSIEIIASQGDDFDALVDRGARMGGVYLVGDGFIANGPVSLLGKAHRFIGGEFR
jgi:hypothetical protein